MGLDATACSLNSKMPVLGASSGAYSQRRLVNLRQISELSVCQAKVEVEEMSVSSRIKSFEEKKVNVEQQ
jgi:hypothetical protein